MNVAVKRLLPVALPFGTWAVVLAMASGDAQTASPQSPAAEPAVQTAAAPAILTQYCITCHNGRLKTAGLAL